MADLDLAVVGGGVAGAYVAYRVAQQHPGWSITLFERSNRVGGRLLSLMAPGIDGVRAELGGMRFRTSQPNVAALVAELGLPVRPFRTVDDANLYLLRGRRLRANGFRGDGAPAYDLPRRFRGLTPAEVLFAAIETVVPDALAMSTSEWTAAKAGLTYQSRPLSDWPIDDLLELVAGRDGRRFIADGFGYEAIFGDRNAADCIPWLLIEARPETENLTLVDGMEALPRTLAARFIAAGGAIQYEATVTAIRRSGPGSVGGFELACADGSTTLAARVVLALPPPALERIAGPFEDGPSRELLRSVDVRAAAKLSLLYEEPWWRAGLGDGLRAVTDGPLQKVYLFDRAAPAQPGGALLLVYTDGSAREHWAGLADAVAAAPDDQPLSSLRRWAGYLAPGRLIQGATDELRGLFELAVPPPRAAAFKDWGGGDEFGAYSVWRAGRPSWELMPQLIQPSAGDPLYICGESFAESQGWVEGALETASVVIARLTA